MSGGIYVIRLSDTHYYGGRTKHFQTRWQVHQKMLKAGTHFNRHMQSVFDLHGRFEPDVVCALPVEEQREAEKVWLDANVGKPGCLNKSMSADGVHPGYKHSKETCAKHRRPIHTPESKEKCRLAGLRRKPKVVTDEDRARLSAHMKRAWVRAKATGKTWKTGVPAGTHSDETLRRMSESQIGKHVSEETRLRISEALTGRKGPPKSEEQKAHQAEKMREYWSDPEACRAQSERQMGRPPTKGMSGRTHSPETRKKMSEARRATVLRKAAEKEQG